MKNTKLIFTATLALGLLFCVNDATAQAAKKVDTSQKAQTTQQIKKAKTYTHNGRTAVVVPKSMIINVGGANTINRPQLKTRKRQD